MIEESPSPVVSPELRAALGAEAVALARAAGYVNAGTVEFIADFARPRRALLPGDERAAAGRAPRDRARHRPRPGGAAAARRRRRAAAARAGRGRAARPRDRGAHQRRGRRRAASCPPTGRVLAYRAAATAPACASTTRSSRAREVDTDYDSLLAKVIAHGADRAPALGRLDRALAGLRACSASTTNTALPARAARRRRRSAPDELDTGLIERRGVRGRTDRATRASRIAARRCSSLADRGARAGDDPFDARRRLAARRRPRPVALAAGGERRRAGRRHRAAGVRGDGRARSATARFAIDGPRRVAAAPRDGDVTWIGHGGCGVGGAAGLGARTRADAARRRRRCARRCPGRCCSSTRAVGDRVSAGDPLVVLESMKMELVARRAGRRRRSPSSPSPSATRSRVDQPLARVEAVRRSSVLRSPRQPRASERVPRQPRGQRGAGRATCDAQLERVRAGRRRARPRAPRRRAASCCRASASTACSTRARRSWSCSALAAHGLYDDEAPGRGDHHRHRPRVAGASA